MPTTPALWLAALTNGMGVTNPPFSLAVIPPPPPPAPDCQYRVPQYNPAAGIPPHGPAVSVTYQMNGVQVGVDLNRNFHTPAWGYNCPPNFINATADRPSYFGPSVASETETGFLEAFFAGRANLRTSIDYHSYSKYILYPSEVANTPGMLTASYTNLGLMMQQLIDIAYPSPGPPPDYDLGTPMALINYDATGTLADHAGITYNSRAFVIELDPAHNSLIGFQLPETSIRNVFEKNIRAALGLIASAGERRASCFCGAFRWTVSGGERAFLNWDVFNRGNQLPL